ncbi:DUF6894 family protein [Methylobacterium iners]|uniref:DUF6894 family protein n=1 Tax=Methylobacterium iners TaxID=418707 RepID=UPI0035A2453B
MPRYYFNLRHKPGPRGLAEDLEGDELADLGAARAQALRSARDLISRTRSHGVRDWFVCSFEIMGADGRPLLPVPFADTVRETEDGA